MRFAFWMLVGTVAAWLGGCSVVYPRVQIDESPPAPVEPTVAVPPANGSLYHSASYRPLFEEHRARAAGDTLTVAIIEKVSASAKSNSTVEKKGGLDASIKALPGAKTNSFAAGRAAATGSASNSFDGKGSTESSIPSGQPMSPTAP